MQEELQKKYSIVVTGPTIFAALLNSLRMGFRALAIQRRSGEVWKILSAVKSEFEKFGGVLDKLRKQLDTATKPVADAGTRTRVMQRKLRDVEQLPGDPAGETLELPDARVAIVEEDP